MQKYVIIAKCIKIEEVPEHPGKYYLYFNKRIPNNNRDIIWLRSAKQSFSYATSRFDYNVLCLICSKCLIELNMYCAIYNISHETFKNPIVKESLWHELGSLENPTEDEIACYIRLLNEA